MNKTLLGFLVLALGMAMLGTGCKKDDPNSFRVEATDNFSIPGGIGLNVPIEERLDLPKMAIDSALSGRGLNQDNLSEIYINYLGMEIIRPFGVTFGFLSRVEVYVDNPNMNEVMIGFLDNPPANIGNFIELEILQAPIQSYFAEDDSELIIRYWAKDFVLNKLDLNFYQSYQVLVNP